MASFSLAAQAKEEGVVKFYDGARNYGICVGSSGRCTGKDVFVMGNALSPGFTPQASDVLAFTLVVKVRSSGTEKLEAANISLLSRGEGIATRSRGDNKTRNDTRSNTSRNNKVSQNGVQDLIKTTAKLSITPKGQTNNNATSRHKNSSDVANKSKEQRAKPQQGKQRKKKPVNTNAQKKSNVPQKQGSQTKRDKARQNRRRNSHSTDDSTDDSKKFAESKMFSSPDPSELPMPEMVMQQHGTPDAKTRFASSEKFAESAMFCGSPDPKCLPMPRF